MKKIILAILLTFIITAPLCYTDEYYDSISNSCQSKKNFKKIKK